MIILKILVINNQENLHLILIELLFIEEIN